MLHLNLLMLNKNTYSQVLPYMEIFWFFCSHPISKYFTGSDNPDRTDYKKCAICWEWLCFCVFIGKLSNILPKETACPHKISWKLVLWLWSYSKNKLQCSKNPVPTYLPPGSVSPVSHQTLQMLLLCLQCATWQKRLFSFAIRVQK